MRLGGSINRCSKYNMNTLYMALPYVIIFAQTLCAAMLASRYAGSRLVKSKWKLVLLAAFPIPAIVAGFAIFAFADVLTGIPPGCAADACASERAAFSTLMYSALALYLIGLVTALIGYRSGKARFESRQPE